MTRAGESRCCFFAWWQCLDIHAVQFPAETRYCLHMFPKYLCFKAWLKLQVCWAHPWICTSEGMGTFRVTGPALPCLWLLYRVLPHMAINSFAVEKETLERLQNIQNIEKGETESCLILRTQSPSPCEKIQGFLHKKKPLAEF